MTPILCGLADLQSHMVPLTLLVPALEQPPASWVLLGACKKDGDRLPSRARWGRTRDDGLTLKEGQGEIFLQGKW